MKATLFASVLMTSLFSMASAWSVIFYQDIDYLNAIYSKSGTVTLGCTNLAGNINDKTSSMKYAGNCAISLYQDGNCQNRIGYSQGNWNIRQFSPGANDQLTSYRIDC